MTVSQQFYKCSSRVCWPTDPIAKNAFMDLQQYINAALYDVYKRTGKYVADPIAIDGYIGPKTVSALNGLTFAKPLSSVAGTIRVSGHEDAAHRAPEIGRALGPWTDAPEWAVEGKKAATAPAPRKAASPKEAHDRAGGIPWWAWLVGGYIIYRVVKR